MEKYELFGRSLTIKVIVKISAKRLFISVSAIAVVLIIGFIGNIHQFLSAESPVDPEILIFESWIYNIDNSVNEAIVEFQRGNYRFIVLTGFDKDSEDIQSEDDNPVKAKEAFIQGGIAPDRLFTVMVPQVQKHRTFSMALACRIWIENQGIKAKNINVFTFGPHARKSEVVFKQVMEPDYHVGVISAKPTHYNPKYWWCSWMGIKWVFYDFLKYVRASIC